MKHLAIVLFLVYSLGAHIPTDDAVASASTTACVSSRVTSAMPRRPVRSSNISSIGYDAYFSILEVEFTTGAVYQYYGVPKLVYEGLMKASSHGSYLADHVKGRYRYKEV